MRSGICHKLQEGCLCRQHWAAGAVIAACGPKAVGHGDVQRRSGLSRSFMYLSQSIKSLRLPAQAVWGSRGCCQGMQIQSCGSWRRAAARSGKPW